MIVIHCHVWDKDGLQSLLPSDGQKSAPSMLGAGLMSGCGTVGCTSYEGPNHFIVRFKGVWRVEELGICAPRVDVVVVRNPGLRFRDFWHDGCRGNI